MTFTSKLRMGKYVKALNTAFLDMHTITHVMRDLYRYGLRLMPFLLQNPLETQFKLLSFCTSVHGFFLVKISK